MITRCNVPVVGSYLADVFTMGDLHSSATPTAPHCYRWCKFTPGVTFPVNNLSYRTNRLRGTYQKLPENKLKALSSELTMCSSPKKASTSAGGSPGLKNGARCTGQGSTYSTATVRGRSFPSGWERLSSSEQDILHADQEGEKQCRRETGPIGTGWKPGGCVGTLPHHGSNSLDILSRSLELL